MLRFFSSFLLFTFLTSVHVSWFSHLWTLHSRTYCARLLWALHKYLECKNCLTNLTYPNWLLWHLLIEWLLLLFHVSQGWESFIARPWALWNNRWLMSAMNTVYSSFANSSLGSEVSLYTCYPIWRHSNISATSLLAHLTL